MVEPAASAVEEWLASDRAVVVEHVLALLDSARPRDLYDLARDYPTRPSKGLRASICLSACRAFGGTTRDGLEVATAIELLHNSFLVLDDIQDASMRRRGAPTLHVEHGGRAAISAATALLSLAMERVLVAVREMPQLAVALMSEFVHLLRRTQEGQWTELTWVRDGRVDLTEADYLAMVQDKTCWYTTIHPLRIGALVGSRGRADLDRLVPFGFYLGAVFQIADDRGNLVDRSPLYGKDVGGDIAEGKRTLPIIDLLAAASDGDRREVLELLGDERAEGRVERLERMRGLIDRYGSLGRADAFADGVAALAMSSFETTFAEARPGPDLDLLRELVSFVRGGRDEQLIRTASPPRA
jgi:geranylgeranyl diphosphate synthase type II